jgi:hypothetical protein
MYDYFLVFDDEVSKETFRFSTNALTCPLRRSFTYGKVIRLAVRSLFCTRHTAGQGTEERIVCHLYILVGHTDHFFSSFQGSPTRSHTANRTMSLLWPPRFERFVIPEARGIQRSGQFYHPFCFAETLDRLCEKPGRCLSLEKTVCADIALLRCIVYQYAEVPVAIFFLFSSDVFVMMRCVLPPKPLARPIDVMSSQGIGITRYSSRTSAP